MCSCLGWLPCVHPPQSQREAVPAAAATRDHTCGRHRAWRDSLCRFSGRGSVGAHEAAQPCGGTAAGKAKHRSWDLLGLGSRRCPCLRAA